MIGRMNERSVSGSSPRAANGSQAKIAPSQLHNSHMSISCIGQPIALRDARGGQLWRDVLYGNIDPFADQVIHSGR